VLSAATKLNPKLLNVGMFTFIPVGNVSGLTLSRSKISLLTKHPVLPSISELPGGQKFISTGG
jgi:hypothetical protein